MILAINALKIAVGKKHIANALITRNDRFFTLVSKYGRNAEGRIRFAIAQLSGKTVGITIPWTNPASLQFFEQLQQFTIF